MECSGYGNFLVFYVNEWLENMLEPLKKVEKYTKEEILLFLLSTITIGLYIKDVFLTIFQFVNSIEFFKILMQYGILALLIQYLLNKLKYNQDQKLKETEKNNTKEIQREAFYRTQNGDELKKIVTEFTLVITDPTKFGKAKIKGKRTPVEDENKQHVIDIMNLLVIYGSEEAILIAGILMQLSYKISSEEHEKESEDIKSKDKQTLYWLAAELVSRLKSDYTGITIEPMDIIKLKITDLNKAETKKKFELGKKEAKILIETEKNNRKINK
ncbi:MAG: hypothetical protein ABS916_00135 [Carnobacterium sp.]